MRLRVVVSLVVMFLLCGLTVSKAEPQRIPIKTANKMAKEHSAKAQLKNINLQDIEDPVARRAIGEILNYLNLQSKK